MEKKRSVSQSSCFEFFYRVEFKLDSVPTINYSPSWKLPLNKCWLIFQTVSKETAKGHKPKKKKKTP